MAPLLEGVNEQPAVAADSTSITKHPGTRSLHVEVGFRLTGPKGSSLGLRRQSNADQQSPVLRRRTRHPSHREKVKESDGPALLSLLLPSPCL